MGSAIGIAISPEDVRDFQSAPGPGLDRGVAAPVAVVRPDSDDRIGGKSCVDSAHESLLDGPNPCGPVRFQPD